MTPGNQTDNDLAQALCEKHPEALALLYQRHARLVHSVIRGIAKNRNVTEDLVQETFLRAWTRSRSFDPAKGGLASWLVCIARNLAIDHLRSHDVRLTAKSEPLSESRQACHSRYAVASRTFHRERGYLRTLLERLPLREKQVLELAYVEGCSQSEIAKRLQAPLGTVKSRMRSGIVRLRLAF